MNEPSSQDGMRYCFKGDIPVHYDDAVVGVMLCNPHRLFVYWELPGHYRDCNLPLLLRLYESGSQTTEGSGAVVEIEIPAEQTATTLESLSPVLHTPSNCSESLPTDPVKSFFPHNNPFLVLSRPLSPLLLSTRRPIHPGTMPTLQRNPPTLQRNPPAFQKD